MTDLVALKAELENNPRYDDSVRRGDNTMTTALLSELEPGQSRFLVIDVALVKDAIGNGVRNLSTEEMRSLTFFVPPTGSVDFRLPGIRSTINGIFAGKQGTLNKLLAVSQQDRTYGEAFGGRVSLNDVRAAVKQIAKAAINQ